MERLSFIDHCSTCILKGLTTAMPPSTATPKKRKESTIHVMSQNYYQDLAQLAISINNNKAYTGCASVRPTIKGRVHRGSSQITYDASDVADTDSRSSKKKIEAKSHGMPEKPQRYHDLKTAVSNGGRTSSRILATY